MAIPYVSDFFNTLIKVSDAVRKDSTAAYFDIEHNMDSNVFVTNTGALVSIWRVRGMQSIPGDREWRNGAELIHTALTKLFRTDGCDLQWTFEHDDSKTNQYIRDMYKSAFDTSDRIQLNVKDIIEEYIKVNTEFCSFEESYIAIWSDLRHINANLIKSLQKEKNVQASSLEYYLRNAPNLFGSFKDLYIKHTSVAEDFANDFANASILLEPLEVGEASNIIKCQINRSTSKDWRPLLVGDARWLKTLFNGEENKDCSELLTTKLNELVANTPYEYVKPSVIKLGTHLHKSGEVCTFPVSIKPFRTLARSVDKDIPYRLSFRIRSGRGWRWSVETAIGIFANVLHSDNKRISREREYLENMAEQEPSPRVTCTFTTWSDDEERLSYQYERLKSAIEGWGISETQEDRSDEMSVFADTVIGAKQGSVAAESYMPIGDIIKMLPFDRTAQVWDTCGMLFYTLQNKPFPWNAINSKLKPSIELYIAQSRQGKSVISNSNLLMMCLMPGLRELPFMCSIDVGFSSGPMFKFIKNRLPASQKHLVQELVLSVKGDEGINVFQKSPGISGLFEFQSSFVNSFLACIAQDAKGELHPNMIGLIQLTVEETYKSLCGKDAKEYHAGYSQLVDEWIKNTNYELDSRTSWWEIEQEAANQGCWDVASECAIHSSPVLGDFSTVAMKTETIQNLYGKGVLNGETAIDLFKLRIQEAVNAYPVLSRPSTINFNEARLRNIDLQNVLLKDDTIGPRNNGIMYAVAMYLGSGDFFFNREMITKVPSQYKAYYEKRVFAQRSLPNRIFMDEFHNCKGNPNTLSLVDRYAREGGKWGINTGIASQKAEDFNSTLIEQARSYFFLGQVSKAQVTLMKENFSLTDTECAVLTNGTVHGPQRGGSSFLYVYKPDGERYSQVLNFPAGPKNLWINSTNPIDINLKNALGDSHPDDYIDILANKYPSGNAEKEKAVVESMMTSSDKSSEAILIESALKKWAGIDTSML